MKDLLLNIANITNIVCTIIIAFHYKNLKSFGRIIFLLFLGNSLVDTTATILIKIFNQTTLKVYFIWFECIVFFMIWLYGKIPGPFYKKPWLKLYIPFGICITTYGVIQDILGKSVIWPINVSTIFLLIISYILLRHLISEVQFDTHNPLHWIVAANTAYCVLNIQSWAGAFYFYLQNNYRLVELFYILNIIGYMSSSIIICYAILKSPKYELA